MKQPPSIIQRIAIIGTIAGSFSGVTSGNDWAQWRGPNRDGIANESGLLSTWPEEGPAITHRTKGLGSGMASVAIADGKLFTIGNSDK